MLNKVSGKGWVGIRGHVEQHCAGCVDLGVVIVMGAIASGCKGGGEEATAQGQGHGQLIELGTAEGSRGISAALVLRE
jgi:hypothetical protein